MGVTIHVSPQEILTGQMVFPGGTSGRELKYLPVFYELKVPASAGDTRDVASIPGSGKSPEGGHGNPLQCSFLENRMD